MKKSKFELMKLVLGLLVMLLACSPFVRSQNASPPGGEESFTKTGQQVPSFTVTDLSGTPINIDDLKGKIVLVNFWATWCAPCLREMPQLEKQIWRKFKSDEFAMIAIAREESEPDIIKFRNEYGYSFPMAADPEREVYKLFASEGIPRIYVMGADGKILFQSVGYDPSEFAEMKKIIGKELKKLQTSKPSK